jgi:hypothetical protein
MVSYDCAVCPSGCTENVVTDFNARVMWRENGALESYMYYPNKTSICGDSWLWNAAAGSTWNFVKMYVRMNDVGALPGLFSYVKHPHVGGPLR